MDLYMKNINLLFILTLTLITFLTGCAPIYRTQYTFVPPKTDIAKMCTAQCVQGKNTCEQMCRMNNENCLLRAQQDAEHQFEIYKNDQLRQGKEVKRDMNSFKHTYSCRSSCNCEPTYRSCYTSCGGQITQKQVCVAFCDKQ